MTEVETGRKSLECAVLWLSQWKRKEDCLSHIGLKRDGGQLRVLQSSKGAVECISDSDPSRRPCSWPCIGDDSDSEGQLSYFAHHFINRRTEARLAKDFAFKTAWAKIYLCFCLGVSLCLQNAGCLWVQACCLEKEVQGSKRFMHRFWSWGASVGHNITQETCGKPKPTTQSGTSVILHRTQNLTQIWKEITMWCQQKHLGCISSEAFIKTQS